MAYDYDALYAKTPNALGDPTPEIAEVFRDQPPETIDVLDIGCGQGRDALFIARLGHRVVGVDLSPNGIRDLLAAAQREGLDIVGIVADLRKFEPGEDFDIILIDRTLHILTPDEQGQLLGRLLDHVRETGRVLIADERSNIPRFKEVVSSHSRSWRIELENRGYLFLRHELRQGTVGSPPKS